MFQFAGFASPKPILFSLVTPLPFNAVPDRSGAALNGEGGFPFGNRGIKACSQLPHAYRSVPRPSSPVHAKAFTKCPYLTLESPHPQRQRWAMLTKSARHSASIAADRKSVVSGKSVSGRLCLGGGRIITKKKQE